MSVHRSPWDDAEELLLRQVHSEMPGAALRQIWQAFDKTNHQRRTKHAVKAKMKDLGLSVERGHDEVTISSPPEEQISTPSQQFSRMRYNRSASKPRIPIPLHPLIAEARRHVAHVRTAGYASNVSPSTRWASILEGADISRLKCAEADRVALMAYMDYLRG